MVCNPPTSSMAPLHLDSGSVCAPGAVRRSEGRSSNAGQLSLSSSGIFESEMEKYLTCPTEFYKIIILLLLPGWDPCCFARGATYAMHYNSVFDHDKVKWVHDMQLTAPLHCSACACKYGSCSSDFPWTMSNCIEYTQEWLSQIETFCKLLGLVCVCLVSCIEYLNEGIHKTGSGKGFAPLFCSSWLA